MSGGSQHTEAVGRLLKALDEHKSMDYLRKMYEENMRLRQENTTLKTVSDEMDRRLARYLEEADRSNDKAKKAAGELKVELQRRKELENKAEGAVGRLKVVELDMVKMSNELQRLSGFAAEMKPLSADIKQRLESLYTSARDLAQAYFGTDFPEEMISDASRWTNIDGHCCVKKSIPLLDSNTLSAKQMRVAAVLAILAWELAGLCFRPTYVLDEENDLFDVMSDMAKHDPSREVYLRSVLLEILNETGQKRAVQRRVVHATNEIFAIIGHPFDQSDQNSLREAIKVLCTEACEHWGHVQRLRAKIEPEFEPTADPKPEHWAPLTIKLVESTGTATPAASNQKLQNGGSGSNPGKRTKQAGPQQAQQQQPQPDSAAELSGIPIWPMFVVTGDPADGDVLTKGYVLRHSYLQTAFDEQRAQQSTGRRRDMREGLRRTRTKSMSAGVEAPGISTGDVTPTVSESFLSPRLGGGQKVG
ncbi:hypothetical protein QBC47DRAFT_217642 [Echria macrotheca]|uniref:Uncharacterized protein n=1 Tax=Echria macrotheca TaxID=438768 RepID=A0AAJ0FAQ7_9PEZI|nr:hypothetical protein QBC47DRAFT_217642 [Echria macrotheca]